MMGPTRCQLRYTHLRTHCHDDIYVGRLHEYIAAPTPTHTPTLTPTLTLTATPTPALTPTPAPDSDPDPHPHPDADPDSDWRLTADARAAGGAPFVYKGLVAHIARRWQTVLQIKFEAGSARVLRSWARVPRGACLFLAACGVHAFVGGVAGWGLLCGYSISSRKQQQQRRSQPAAPEPLQTL